MRGALYGLINARLGVSGAWLATLAPVERRQQRPPSTEPETSAATRAASVT